MSEPAFPLQWPTGWKRTASRQSSRFGRGGMTMGKALDFLEAELGRLDGRHAVFSSNVRARPDGRPYANERAPQDPGVAVYFTLAQRRLVLACDRWTTAADNFYAVALHIEAMRGQERWGVGSLAQAFAGYAALPAKSGPSMWEWLGIADRPDLTEAEVVAAWKRMATVQHPDKGGSDALMAGLNEAKDNALAMLRGRAR